MFSALAKAFDAGDGRQARKTNSSGPLNHGCNGVAGAVEALAFGSTAMCGCDTFWFWVINCSFLLHHLGTVHVSKYFTSTLILTIWIYRGSHVDIFHFRIS